MIGVKKFAMKGVADVAVKATLYETEEEFDEAFDEIMRTMSACYAIDANCKKHIKEARDEKIQ
jgi:hypothetical protein